MPKTAAFAVAASRGFGEFTSGLVLTTVTFTSDATWTAPPYVNTLVQMVGYGTNATSDNYPGITDNTLIYRCSRATSGGTSGTYDWSYIYNNLQDWITYINTGTPGTRSSTPIGRVFTNGYGIFTDNTYSGTPSAVVPAGSNGFAPEYFEIGSGSDGSQFSVPSSGTITYANTPTNNSNNTVRVNFRPVYLGSDGTAATGVGKTFPGGTYDFATGIGGAAPTTTFSNVTVTPSSSYSIVVPSGGQIAISFYAPAL
jgi:hypothetical protein